MPSILITGGTRGIGFALSKNFLKNGWKVAVCYHQDEASAQNAKDEFGAIGGEFLIEKCDVTQEAEVQPFVQTVLQKWGSLDCAIHNAGATWNARILNVEEPQWDDTLNVHLKGAFWLSKACLRPMMKQKGGHLIFITSIMATTGNIGQASYTAAKAGVIGLGKSIAQEYGSKNIRANMVCPGFQKTRLTAGMTPEAEQAIRDKHLLGMTADLQEVADFMIWLAGTRTISGQVFNLDSRLPGRS